MYKNPVIAVGNFDGVHKGHRALLQRAIEIADETSERAAIMTFHPHPRIFFARDEKPFLLTRPNEQFALIEDAGMDYMIDVSFNHYMAELSAKEFIQEVLIEDNNASCIVVGSDFRFGKDRGGDVAFLQKECEAAGVRVSVVDPVKDDDNQIISSSRIRNFIRDGDIDKANFLLGHEWQIVSVVQHGDKRGRELGYPTANLYLDPYVYPKFGVWACKVALYDADDAQSDEDVALSSWMDAVANIGIRPMFESKDPLVEVHIFDFDEEIYGRRLCVKLHSYLRGEEKFNSLDALIQQMEKDCAQARTLLSSKAG